MTNNDLILLIHNNPEQLAMLTACLAAAGSQVLSSDTTHNALEIAEGKFIKLIICHLSTLDHGSLEKYKSIPAQNSLSQIPILIIGELPKDATMAADRVAPGIDNYLEMPCDPFYFVAQTVHLI